MTPYTPRHARRKEPAMKKEPAITIGTISAAVAAVLALLVAFGIPVTEEQQTAILGVVAALGPIVTGLIVRRKVSPAQGRSRD